MLPIALAQSGSADDASWAACCGRSQCRWGPYCAADCIDLAFTTQPTGNKMPSSNLAIIISPNILRVCSELPLAPQLTMLIGQAQSET